MSAVHNQMAQNARTKYHNSLKITNQNYGSSFQPVELDTGATPGVAGGGAPPAPGGKVIHYKIVNGQLVPQ
jgi:hypothetical protein